MINGHKPRLVPLQSWLRPRWNNAASLSWRSSGELWCHCLPYGSCPLWGVCRTFMTLRTGNKERSFLCSVAPQSEVRAPGPVYLLCRNVDWLDFCRACAGTSCYGSWVWRSCHTRKTLLCFSPPPPPPLPWVSLLLHSGPWVLVGKDRDSSVPFQLSIHWHVFFTFCSAVLFLG